MRTFANPTASTGPNGTVSGALLDRPGSILVAQAVPAIFVIPAYNEEENLPRLFADLESRPGLFTAQQPHPRRRRRLARTRPPRSSRAYDGPLPVELVDLERNQGPGGAFRAGFAAALDGCPEDALIVTLEADTTSDLDALPGDARAAHATAPTSSSRPG